MTLLDESMEGLLEPGIDIEVGTQRRILQFERHLTTANHYELLGVPMDAEKKEIKSAYYALMNEFHTDKYFGKNLGAFGPKMGRIVDALTKANDTLGRKKTREAYDAALARRPPTSNRSETPSRAPGRGDARKAVAPIDVVRIPGAPRTPQFSGAASNEQPTVFSPVADNPSNAGRSSIPPARSSSSSRPPETVQEDRVSPSPSIPPGHPSSVPPPNDARRKLLARKMGARVGGRLSEDQRKRNVQADLRARYDARRNQESDRIANCRTTAAAAIRDQNWTEAIGAMKRALSFKPGDPGLTAELEAVQAQADQALAPKFLEQARMEERSGHYEQAARCYERAARGFDSAEFFNKGASCLLKGPSLREEQQRKAVELARRAVGLDKRKALYRITLARAYDAAGMKTSALGELQRALEIEPNNDEAKDLHKRLK